MIEAPAKPDTIDSGWPAGLYRSAGMRGLPALTLMVPLAGLTLIDRWLTAKHGS